MLNGLLARYNPAAPETDVTTTARNDSSHGTVSGSANVELSNDLGLDKAKRAIASLPRPRKDFPERN